MISNKQACRLLMAVAVAGMAAACSSFGACNSSACAEDQRIAAEVKGRLHADSAFRMGNVHVQARDHVVYLSGLVDTESEQGSAASIAADVPGVRRVVNELAVNNIN